MPVIDDSYAWQIIRDAQNLWPAPENASPVYRSDDELTIGPGVTATHDGRWQSTGDVTASAAALFDTLLPLACGGPQWTIAQLGQSLDGRIATHSGHSHYVTGEPSRVHLHRLRALVDAVIVGAGTVVSDNPQLTVRHVPGRHPLRVVLDPSARVASHHHLFCDDTAPTLHVVSDTAVRPTGHDVLALPCTEQGMEPQAVLDALAARGARRVLVEGGGATISRFLAAGLLDRLHSVVAPLIIGSGRDALSLAPIDTLNQALRPPCRTYPMGEDVLFDFDLRGHSPS